MPVTIDEVVADVEPSQADARSGETRQPERTSSKVDLRRLRTLHARLASRNERVRAD